MITQGQFTKLSKKFFDHVCSGNNPGSIVLAFLDVATPGTGADADIQEFLGNNPITTTATKTFKCFYRRFISDRQRQKAGVDQRVDTLVYISTIDINNQMGSKTFSDYIVNGYSSLKVTFLGKHCELLDIRPLEPIQVDGEEQYIAYQIGLRTTTGVKDA